MAKYRFESKLTAEEIRARLAEETKGYEETEQGDLYSEWLSENKLCIFYKKESISSSQGLR